MIYVVFAPVSVRRNLLQHILRKSRAIQIHHANCWLLLFELLFHLICLRGYCFSLSVTVHKIVLRSDWHSDISYKNPIKALFTCLFRTKTLRTLFSHWHILIWTACYNTCWLKACVANWSWRIWEWLLMGYNADHTHLSSNMSHDLYSLLWFTYECLLVVAVCRILFILK